MSTVTVQLFASYAEAFGESVRQTTEQTAFAGALAAVAARLDETAPDWSHSVKDIRQIGEVITVTVAITINGITREGVGTGLAGSELGIKKAEHDALKRAGVKFGIARDLYKKLFPDAARLRVFVGSFKQIFALLAVDPSSN